MARERFYLYIVECREGTYYTGTTNDIERRWREHLEGSGANYTRKRGVRRLIFVKEFQSISEARIQEWGVRKWSQAKKRKLISGEWQ